MTVLLSICFIVIFLYRATNNVDKSTPFDKNHTCLLEKLPDIDSYCPIDMSLKIAIVSTALPKPCGIATFSNDVRRYLLKSIHSAQIDSKIDIIALDEKPEGHDYGDEVVYFIQMDDQNRYETAAQFISQRQYDIVVLQHEFGIYGGKYGEYIVRLMQELQQYKIPMIVNLHTVLSDPPLYLIAIIESMSQIAQQLHVLSPSACKMLVEKYNVDMRKCKHFPHGVDDAVISTINPVRSRFRDRKVILTFGLMSQNKGLEYMIDAMKTISSAHPEALYVILGSVHPSLGNQLFLENMKNSVRENKLENHVMFIEKFVSDEELLDFMSNTDIYVTPYPHLEQISSGTVSRAIAMGLPVVSTRFTYASDVLADGRGVLVDIKDSNQLAEAINGLLSNPTSMRNIACAAKKYGRSFAWSHVSRRYYCQFQNVVTASRTAKKLLHL